MGCLFKRTETKDKMVLELITKNFYLFATLVFLSVIPIIYVAINYIENINVFRVYLVLAMFVVYAILDGKVIMSIIFSRNKTREGSVFSFKNPVRYIIPK